MIDQLEGGELCLAVALGLGATRDPNRPDHERQIVWPDGRIQICAGPDSPVDLLHRWWPLTNQAQRGDVHDWVRAKGYDIHYWKSVHGGPDWEPGDIVCTLSNAESNEWDGTGPDDATALCRAVVGLAQSDDQP